MSSCETCKNKDNCTYQKMFKESEIFLQEIRDFQLGQYKQMKEFYIKLVDYLDNSIQILEKSKTVFTCPNKR